jgi:hypothetical protein
MNEGNQGPIQKAGWVLLGLAVAAAIAILVFRRSRASTRPPHRVSEAELDAALEMTFPASDPLAF